MKNLFVIIIICFISISCAQGVKPIRISDEGKTVELNCILLDDPYIKCCKKTNLKDCRTINIEEKLTAEKCKGVSKWAGFSEFSRIYKDCMRGKIKNWGEYGEVEYIR
jgi:hypothetical protein